MPVTLNVNALKFKDGNSFIPIGAVDSSCEIGFTSPEFFGAIGDGVADDTAAWQAAVDSGMNVRAFHKAYKCGKITVTKNITIDCNDADFSCMGTELFEINGEVKATLTGQPNYSANQVGYSLTSTGYRDYTGYAMLQGTNNFDESRLYYYGGFVCTFRNGVMDGAYPVDARNGTNNLTVLIIEPVTVNLKNVGTITHPSGGYPYSIKITYGYGCVVENVKATKLESYTFIALNNCLKCTCRNIHFSGEYGTTGTASYVVAFLNSSYCVLRDSHIYNKFWHCFTTGANYLCYRNLVENCVLLNDTGYAADDHENGVGTIYRDCTVAGFAPGMQAVIENCIVLSNKNADKRCAIYTKHPTDQSLAGVTIADVLFVPDDDCSVCGICLNTYPQQTGKTYYVDNVKVERCRVNSDTVTGKVWFGFGADTGAQKNWVIGNLMFNDVDLTIDLTCTNPYADTSNMVAKQAVYEDVT